jgi:hypothetical protein
MADVWTFRDMAPTPDLTGFSVEATDGGIGKIDEATYDAGTSSVVVDTGFWIFGKRRMIPAGAIRSVDPGERSVKLYLSKEQVKGAPDFDDARRDDQTYRDQVAVYYRRWPTWETRQQVSAERSGPGEPGSLR